MLLQSASCNSSSQCGRRRRSAAVADGLDTVGTPVAIGSPAHRVALPISATFAVSCEVQAIGAPRCAGHVQVVQNPCHSRSPEKLSGLFCIATRVSLEVTEIIAAVLWLAHKPPSLPRYKAASVCFCPVQGYHMLLMLVLLCW